jgi:acyl phosphate:glycerol-3-phosphate acyltransferase
MHPHLNLHAIFTPEISLKEAKNWRKIPDMLIKIISPLVIGYLIGSIPFGLIAGKIKGIDIRKVGSGNIGATNIYRALGTWPALMVFALDLLKGTLAVYIATVLLPIDTPILPREYHIILSGIAAVCGHMFSIFLNFKGGKGAATSLGILLGITPDLFGIAILYVILCIAITRYVSITSITGVALIAILMVIFHEPQAYILATVIVAALMIYKHIPNIKRLLAGTEPKIWGKKK